MGEWIYICTGSSKLLAQFSRKKQLQPIFILFSSVVYLLMYLSFLSGLLNICE